MATTTFKQAEIDHELVRLVQSSPSINALSQEDREKVTLRIFTFAVPEQLKIKDMLIQEQEDLAKANPEDMHRHYMEMKEVYEDLKKEKTSLEGKVRKMHEGKSREEEAKEIEILEQKLNDDN